MSKVKFVVSGRLTAFHHSAAGGLVICMAPDVLKGADPDALQAIPATAEASLSVEIEIPESPVAVHSDDPEEGRAEIPVRRDRRGTP